MPRSSTDIAAPQVANLNSLANNAAKPLGVVNFETNNAHDASLKLKVQLAATGIDANGTLELYFIGSADGVDWTDDIDPASVTDVSGSIVNAKRLDVLDANVDNLLLIDVIDIFSAIGNSYQQGCVIVWNKSGAASQATGNDADYQTVNYG